MKKNLSNQTIIGIDPGSTVTGWGIISETSGILGLVDCGAIKNPKADFNSRLSYIFHALSEICKSYQPQEAAIEQIFVAKNALSALKLGQARGIALACCMQYNIPVFDYEPTKVKQAVVGNGRADKTQVAFMVKTLLNQKELPKILDTTDALAIAICHANSRRFF